MSNSVNNVVVAKPLVTGGALVAPVGSTLPTDATTALDVAFKPVGYITDNGVTKSEKRNSSLLFAWGGDTIAVTQKGHEVTVKVALAEFLNDLTQSIIYGSANVTKTAADSTHGTKLAVKATSAQSPANAWVFEIRNDAKSVRVVFPNARVTDQGDAVFKDDSILANDVTMTCLPDTSGAYFYVYTDDGVHA